MSFSHSFTGRTMISSSHAMCCTISAEAVPIASARAVVSEGS